MMNNIVPGQFAVPFILTDALGNSFSFKNDGSGNALAVLDLSKGGGGSLFEILIGGGGVSFTFGTGGLSMVTSEFATPQLIDMHGNIGDGSTGGNFGYLTVNGNGYLMASVPASIPHSTDATNAATTLNQLIDALVAQGIIELAA